MGKPESRARAYHALSVTIVLLHGHKGDGRIEQCSNFDVYRAAQVHVHVVRSRQNADATLVHLK